MTEPKKPDNNIVRKVFERSGAKAEKISPLFTHYKNPQKAKAKPAKAAGPKGGGKRLPVAIDFGLSRVKLVQLAQDPKGGLEVVLMDEEIYGDDASRAQVTKSKQALEKLLSRNPVGPQVILGLPAKETQTFNFTFPMMSDDELREAVRWKLRQLRPFDLDEEKVKYAILRWESAPTPAQPGVGQQRVTVVCVSNVGLTEKTAVLAEVGLKPVSVQVCPLSLMQARRYSNIPKNPDEVVLWLDLGAEESVVIVEKAGVVYFLRNLSVSGHQLSKQIAQACRVDDAKGEELKTTHGLEAWTPELQSGIPAAGDGTDTAMTVCLSLVSALENLVIDIEHSFKFFSYQVTQSQISRFDRVVLTGGSSNLKKLDSFLSDRLAVPVTRLDPFQSLKIREPLKSQRTDLAADGLRFASALGLAISQLGEPVGISNFMGADRKAKKPNPILHKIKSQPKFALALAVVLLVLVILPQASVMTYYRTEMLAMAQKVKNAKADLKRRQSSQFELAEQEKQLLEKKATLEEKLSLFRLSRRDKTDFSQMLVKLAALMPDEIWVTKLSYNERRLILVGSTAKNDHVIKFLENLKKPDAFNDVAFNYTKRDGKSSVFSFEVTMGVK